jgi:hypothetical protein
MSKIENYRDQDALDNQEVVTPTKLVEIIHKYLTDEDFEGDIQDSCVGPGALGLSMIDKNYKSLTLCDIQQIHIDNLEIMFKKEGRDYTRTTLEPKIEIVDEW